MPYSKRLAKVTRFSAVFGIISILIGGVIALSTFFLTKSSAFYSLLIISGAWSVIGFISLFFAYKLDTGPWGK